MNKHTPERRPKQLSRFGQIALATALIAVLGVGAFLTLGKEEVKSPKKTALSAQPATKTAPEAESTAVAETVDSTRAVTDEPSIDAYRGLGTWVDIWDEGVFDNPEAAVEAMKGRGVSTIYVETSNSKQKYPIKRPDRMKRLISAAHERDMLVVAWYLPDFQDAVKDYARSKAAIAFETDDGQKFDSFALDIESGDVKSVTRRNERLLRISGALREFAGPTYPLGAIIPSPWGMERNGYWDPFPYEDLARIYDVTLPMSYASYHGEGADLAYKDTLNNMRVLRKQKGMAEEPVHLIGGDADKSSGPETRAFVRGATESDGVIGASFYDYTTMSSHNWSAMGPVKEMR